MLNTTNHHLLDGLAYETPSITTIILAALTAVLHVFHAKIVLILLPFQTRNLRCSYYK